jgi:UDP-N-acetylglucosamine diphosphorylase/glucosamine-1-phosphate N-acetyltransferase
MHLCLFEDPKSGNLLPLTYFRPVYDLRCGLLSLRERIVAYLRPRTISLLTRDYLVPVVQEENPGIEVNRVSATECVFVNGRVIMTAKLAHELKKGTEECLFMSRREIVAVRLRGENLVKARSSSYGDALDLSDVKGVPTVELQAGFIGYPWDLVYAGETLLESDFSVIRRKNAGRKPDIHKTAALLGRGNIRFGGKTVVGANVVLDATEGPIQIGDSVKILPTSYIEGPCCIGPGSVIKAGARIYGNTSIGPVCKVGGEIANSVLHSHVNKQHDGFLGHSYLAPWVNLGAGTTTSNLKNTYGHVRVWISGGEVDSGKTFVGLTAGDHVKVGINGTLDTGTVIGVFSNLYGTAIPPKYIPAFTWGSVGSYSTYDLERAIAVAVTVMGRRKVIATDAYKQLFRTIFDLTSNERFGSRA